MAGATVAALGKKVAVYLATDKRAWEAVGAVIAGSVLLLIAPIVIIMAMFSSGGSESIENKIIDNFNASAQSYAEVEQAMVAISDEASSQGVDTQLAQIIYLSTLVGREKTDSGFYSAYIACFKGADNDQLASNLNSAYSLNITTEDLNNAREIIKQNSIDISKFTSPNTKNSKDLVAYCNQAYENGWGYVYGTYGQILDNTLLDYKVAVYPDEINSHIDFIKENWMGKRVTDCIGLIKGYCWLDASSGAILYASGGFSDWSATTIKNDAVIKGEMSSMPETPGIAVCKEGHIGVYIGDGYVIEAYGTRYGVIKTKLADGNWTSWLQIPGIEY